MVNISEQKKELRSFDASLVDPNRNKILIDCQIRLPNIWGEKVDIRLAIPNSNMPIKDFDNPSQLKATCDHSNTRMEMKEVHYRTLTTNIVPSRKTGQTLISLAHIQSLYLTEKNPSKENKFYIYISSLDFFEQYMGSGNKSQIDELSIFNCPKLGRIKLQRYEVKAGVNDSSRMLQCFGYQLEVTFTESVSTTEYILEHIAPTLDLISILLRQRIAVHGWESLKGDSRSRFWKYPLNPIETTYASVQPKNYLVSIEKFQEQVNLGIQNYQLLEQQNKNAIFKLSYSLSPAIELRTEERFMSLFKGLESIASKLPSNKKLTSDDQLLSEHLDKISKTLKQNNPQISDRINGFINNVSKLSLKDKLILLLQNENVQCTDLWEVKGDKGLTGIRNKLAHKGAVGVNHQGLAVSTLHLSLLVERLIFRILGLIIEGHIATQLKQDEWLKASYFNVLKINIFKT